MSQVWAGVDAGKLHHHCVAIDSEGNRLLSRRVANDEPELLQLLSDVGTLAEEQPVTWAIDLADGPATLMIGLLTEHDQHLLYLPGLSVNRAASGYRGSAKTDARDAAVIADQARMRRDLHPLRKGDDVTAELKILTAHRADLVADRTRNTNRLRSLLTSVFPTLERALDLTTIGPLTLLTGHQTPDSVRRTDHSSLASWLHSRKVRNAARLATTAIEAAAKQHITLPGQQLSARIIRRLAEGVLELSKQIKEADALIADRYRRHRHAEIITTLPGIRTQLAAEFLVATGGDMAAFETADRLAGFAGLAPVPRDSGRIRGNLHRPHRYHRGLQRVFYLSAQISIQHCPESRRFYERKRAEGKRHTQAVLALARRRVNVLWALLRDHRRYQPPPPVSLAA
ncbi:transposase [Streptomyces abyssalis]|uniref:Transposase n=1 Tax=Streptomyces abyssalis TaxID=933944 RepID=A0A1E7JPG0_9ACTN|nr:IS110 family transposase [Streptomyces abyssalis]OEU86479.1 transposase [Streptomyces abyssalis]OEU90130.1 transposase [Streptomyces abyssalis]